MMGYDMFYHSVLTQYVLTVNIQSEFNVQRQHAFKFP